MIFLLALLQDGGIPITDTSEAIGRLVGQIVVVLVILFVIRAIWKRKRSKRNSPPPS